MSSVAEFLCSMKFILKAFSEKRGKSYLKLGFLKHGHGKAALKYFSALKYFYICEIVM